MTMLGHHGSLAKYELKESYDRPHSIGCLRCAETELKRKHDYHEHRTIVEPNSEDENFVKRVRINQRMRAATIKFQYDPS